MTGEIRDAEAADEAEWHRMWSANCAHFAASVPASGSRELWRRIMDREHAVNALVCGASDGGSPLLGFANYVLHPHTFSSRMVCYLEDLWIEPSARGGGLARKFIETLVARGRDRGWRRIYWHTEADNVAARRLYDRLARATDYVRYDISLP